MSNEEELPSNWGRWGDEGEKGTLNLITDEVRARAAAEVRTGHWGGRLPRPSPRQGSSSAPAQGSVRESSPVESCWTWQSTGRSPRATR